MEHPGIVQLVLGSENLPLSKHLYSEVLGFASGGERLIYSRHNGEVMGLGLWGGAMLTYMVGRQELVQLEFWTHTTPRQRPLPVDWRPNDHGFVRFGVAVSDFDATLAKLTSLGIRTLTGPGKSHDGLRRVCFRDPTVGIPVEIMEDGAGLPGRRERYHDLDPAIVYVAASVPDLTKSVAFFRDVGGLAPTDVVLHGPEDEALWGLGGAEAETAVLAGGEVFLELTQYRHPAARSRPLDDTLSAQGFRTVALGFRDPHQTGQIFERVKAAGLRWTVSEPVSFIGGNHVTDPVALHMKTLSVPRDLEAVFGYAPEPPRWWPPPGPPSALPSPTDRMTG